MVRSGIAFLLALGGLVVACSATPKATDKICTPDANVFCRCVDRAEGTKKCKADGQSFEACVPCDGSGDKGAGSGGSDGLGSGHGTDSEEAQTRSSKKRTEDEANPSGESDNEKPAPEKDAGSNTTSSSSSSSSGETTTSSSSSSSSSSGSTPKRDAGSSSSSSGSSGSSGTAPDNTTSFPDTTHCKPLKNVAPRIELQKIADDPTPAKGGVPADGLYVQSWVIEFTGEDGESGPSKHYSKETIEIGGDVGRYVFEDEDGTVTHGGFRLSKSEDSANKVNVAYECPATAPKDLAYDATDKSITIYDGKYARIFIRQKDSK